MKKFTFILTFFYNIGSVIDSSHPLKCICTVINMWNPQYTTLYPMIVGEGIK